MSSPEVHLAFLWRLHQPWYLDPVSARFALPWVRLHAASTYTDLAAVLERHPEVRATVSFSPCLLDQIQLYLDGATDSYEEVTRLPAAELPPGKRQFLMRHFFSAHWDHVLRPVPRFRELLEKRGVELPQGGWAEVAGRFTDDEVRDIQVLFNLVWMGASVSGLEQLRERGRDYSEQDKELVLERQHELLQGLLPAWKALHRRGNVSICVTPYYHGMLPLLVDSHTAKRCSPGVRLPQRFAYPGDAEEQVRRAMSRTEQEFGERPRGLWPSEGGISPETVQIAARCMVRYLATDASILYHSLDEAGSARGRRSQYQPYRVGECAVIFRDAELSELLSREYASWDDPQAAAADFLEQVRQAGRGARVENGAPPLVLVVQPAEVWESYPGRGLAFLDALFGLLASQQAVRSVTLEGHLQRYPPTIALDYVHSGSWVEGNFAMWIGEAEKNRAWDLLGQARRRLAMATTASSVDPEATDEAWTHMLRAEGSDWLYWLGEPYSSAEDSIYECLFRGHLAAVYRALEDSPPAVLSRPLSQGGVVDPLRQPRAFINPRIDGRRTSYFEWRDAGFYRVPGTSHHDQAVLSGLYWGFDPGRLFLRLDPVETYRDSYSLLLSGLNILVELSEPLRQLTVELELTGQPRLRLTERLEGGERRDLGLVEDVVCREVIELALPLSRLDLRPGTRLGMSIAFGRQGRPWTRVPLKGVIEVEIPTEDFGEGGQYKV